MDKNSTDRIADLADYIQRFRELDPDEQHWIAELMKNGRLVRTTLNLLDAIADDCLAYEEIADTCELHPNTVKQIIYALSNGGLDIYEQKTGKWIAPLIGGRPRKLRRIKD